MHPTVFTDFQVEVSQIQFTPPGLLGPQYRVKLSSPGNSQCAPLVVNRAHLSDLALTLIARGTVTGLCTDYVAPNGLAASLLGSPEVLVTSLQLNDGHVVDVRPQRIKQWRIGGLFLATIASFGSLAWLSIGNDPLMATAALLCATHFARTFLALARSSVNSFRPPYSQDAIEALNSLPQNGLKSNKGNSIELENRRLPREETS